MVSAQLLLNIAVSERVAARTSFFFPILTLKVRGKLQSRTEQKFHGFKYSVSQWHQDVCSNQTPNPIYNISTDSALILTQQYRVKNVAKGILFLFLPVY